MDWLLYGEDRWPEGWSQGVDAVDWAHGTVNNMLHTGRAFPYEWRERFPGLYFEHFRLVNALQPDFH